jgi:hypothetical protein
MWFHFFEALLHRLNKNKFLIEPPPYLEKKKKLNLWLTYTTGLFYFLMRIY